jgi:hypothetical protein
MYKMCKIRLRQVDKDFIAYILTSFVRSGLAETPILPACSINLGIVKAGKKRLHMILESITRKPLEPYVKFARLIGINFSRPPTAPKGIRLGDFFAKPDPSWGITYILNPKTHGLVTWPKITSNRLMKADDLVVVPCVCDPRDLSRRKQLLSPTKRAVWASTMVHEAAEAHVIKTLGVRVPFLNKHGHVGPLVTYLHGYLAETMSIGNSMYRLLDTGREIRTLFSMGQRDALVGLNECREEAKRDIMKKLKKLKPRSPFVIPARSRKAGPHKKRKGYNSTKRKVRVEEE